jgi:hypothetical protein
MTPVARTLGRVGSPATRSRAAAVMGTTKYAGVLNRASVFYATSGLDVERAENSEAKSAPF